MTNWLNDDSRLFLSRGYLSPGQSAEERIREISETAEAILGERGFADEFEDYMLRGYVALSSPVWSNFGKTGGLPISCNNSYVEDDMDSILMKTAEIGMMSKYGAGTSAFVGALRPRGSIIRSGGTSFGPVHFLGLLQTTTSVVSQSNIRRGNCAVYLPIDHPDIMEFLECREEGHPIQHLSLGVCVSDAFMIRMIDGDPDARRVWMRVLKKRFETGYPYLFFTDTVNRRAPDVYRDKGMRIHSSNLCFTGDTLVAIATGDNPQRIDTLALKREEFPVFSAKFENGSWRPEPKTARAFKTGTMEVVRVHLSDGTSFRCTPEHRLATLSGSYVEAERSVGVELESCAEEHSDVGKISVTRIERTGEVEDVYDLNVDDNHNFYIINGDSGVLVHNCSEIALASSPEESFVCNLSSVNLLHYDEWRSTGLVSAMVRFLDAVMSEYVEKTKDIRLLRAAHLFAKRQRALGIGVLGWHSYLQSKMIPFESEEARRLNVEIHGRIHEESLQASKEMARTHGEPELLEGYGRRHVTLMTNPPTTSSSFILGQVSPSIEPLDSNYFTKDLQKGKFTYKNPYLTKVLRERGRDDAATWKSVLLRGGSVQHLDFLSERERSVFRTFDEISSREVITQAAARQPFIDQSQSVNLKVHPSTPLKEANQLLIDAWRLGVKTMYYQRSTNPAQEYARELMTCSSCEV